MNSWWIFDDSVIIMGPFTTHQEALDTMNMHIAELYLLDDYDDPYVAQEVSDEDYFNPEEFDYVQYKHVDNNGVYGLEDMPVRENYRKRRLR